MEDRTYSKGRILVKFIGTEEDIIKGQVFTFLDSLGNKYKVSYYDFYTSDIKSDNELVNYVALDMEFYPKSSYILDKEFPVVCWIINGAFKISSIKAYINGDTNNTFTTEVSIDPTYLSRFNYCEQYNIKAKLLGQGFGQLVPTTDGILYLTQLASETYMYNTNTSCPMIVPEGVTEIFSLADAKRATSLIIKSNTVDVIPVRYFVDSKLSSIDLGTGVKRIERFAFSRCKGLTDITIPSSVESIEAGAFNKCENLQHVRFNGKKIKFNQLVFYGCSSLQELELPEETTEVHFDIIKDCYKLCRFRLPKYCNHFSFGYNDFYGYNGILEKYPRLVIECYPLLADIVFEKYGIRLREHPKFLVLD